MTKRTSGRPAKDTTTANDWVQVRVTKERKERWTAEAKRRGVSLSQLITDATESTTLAPRAPVA